MDFLRHNNNDDDHDHDHNSNSNSFICDLVMYDFLLHQNVHPILVLLFASERPKVSKVVVRCVGLLLTQENPCFTGFQPPIC